MDFAFDAKEANAQALAYVRKESLDIFNRIHSVQEDIRFVGQVHEAYSELPILRMFLDHVSGVLADTNASCSANLRCGAWYVDPAIVSVRPSHTQTNDD